MSRCLKRMHTQVVSLAFGFLCFLQLSPAHAAVGQYVPAFAGMYQNVRNKALDFKAQSYEQNLMKQAGSVNNISSNTLQSAKSMIDKIGQTQSFAPIAQNLLQQNIGKAGALFSSLSGFSGGFGGAANAISGFMTENSQPNSPEANKNLVSENFQVCPVLQSGKIKAKTIMYASPIAAGQTSLLLRDPNDKKYQDVTGENSPDTNNRKPLSAPGLQMNITD